MRDPDHFINLFLHSMNVDTEKEPREFLRQLEKLHSQIQGLSTTLKFDMLCTCYCCRDSTMNPDMAKAAAKMYFVVYFSVFRNEIIEKIRQLLAKQIPFDCAVPASLLQYLIFFLLS